MRRGSFGSVLLLIALLLAACGNSGSGTQASPAASPAVSAVAEASSAPSPTIAATPTIGPTPIPTPGPDEFANPVIDQDFPDPDTLKVGETYYAYATNSGGTNVQTATSTDLVHWQVIGEALPALPGWASGGFTWAPEVTTTADGAGYLLYFTARDTASNFQCIGVATSDKPEGPFQSTADKALICPTGEGGAIDAGSFVDEDGTRYVLWKNDGNCCGGLTRLYLQKVSADGLTLESEPVKLIENDQLWEGLVVEAPTLWKHGGKYYLFYSANNYAGLDYSVGYAVADQITGPYTKADGPLLKSDIQTGAAIGPGGQDIVLDKDGEPWIMYHSWDPTVSYRRIMIDELAWEGDTPVVRGPDKVPQPLP
ncbi:MAG TPA: glycoside hydrolase family 43 protein [Herpetosiphonaceae bacterium]